MKKKACLCCVPQLLLAHILFFLNLLHTTESIKSPNALTFPNTIHHHQITNDPPSFFLSNFVTLQDIQKLVNNTPPDCYQPDGLLLQTCSLTQLYNKQNNANNHTVNIETTDIFQQIDNKISALLDMPVDFIEEGYLKRYQPGFQFHNIHLDQHVATMRPRRLVSIIIYLDADQSPGSGATIFPLARNRTIPLNTITQEVEPDNSRDSSVSLTQNDDDDGDIDVHAYNVALNTNHKAMRSREFYAIGAGSSIYRRARKMCKEGFGVSPFSPGDAVLFYNFYEKNGQESIRTVHGPCGVLDGKLGRPKNILVKSITDGNVRGVRRQQAEAALAGKLSEEWRLGV